MRIAICHTDFRVYWPARLRAFREYCSAHGAELTVIEISGKGSPYAFAGASSAADGWWQCLFPEARMEDLKPARCGAALSIAFDEIDPEVVMAGAIAFPSGASAVRWARRRNRRVVIMDNARLADVPRSGFVNWVKRRIYSNVDAVLLPAPSHVPDYEFWGIPRARMFFGLNAVDNGCFSQAASQVQRQAQERREQMRLPRRYLLGVGRQIPKKNWHGLLEAWLSFKRTRPHSDLELVLVGDGPERQTLVSKVNQSGRADVHFHDFASQEVMPAYYAFAEALVLPSHGETWGLVVNEAMACGLPVLVSRQCGCAATLVEHRKNGWLIDAESTESVVEALCALDGSDDATLAAMGERSKVIINDWGLERFCHGVWGAIQCALHSDRKYGGLLDWFLLGLWKGRYRPV